MKPEYSIMKLTLSFIMILSLSISVANGAETQTVLWNEVAQSQVINKSKLAKLDAVFPTWKIKQITWPSASEINTNKVTVDPNLTAQCMGWLSKFMNNEQLPIDLDKKLVAMKKWGVIRKESDQKRLCDVFITRFKKGSMTVQIQESPYNVVIAFGNEKLINDPAKNHKNFVIDVANFLLSDKIRHQSGKIIHQSDSESLHVYEITKDDQKITRVTWLIDSLVVTDEKGKKMLDLSKAGDIGITNIEAETDGTFVRFEIVKSPGAVKIAYFDPYVERFGPAK